MERNFWRTQEWLEYLLNSKHGMIYTDHSFFIDNEFVPLVQEEQEFYSPGFEDNKKILTKISELAQQHNIKRIQVDSQIKSYLSISGYTCILDLYDITPRKGHKAAIKKAEKYLSYITDYDIDKFKTDYFRIAGKKTRPDKTFEILEKWRNKGFGILLTAICGRIIVGHIYILHYNNWNGNWAYYFMNCVEPEFRKYNVSHYLQSIAFEILHSKGVEYYELGEQCYNSLITQPTEKEKNISLFKRGFGGEIIEKPISEYFFDKQYFKETMKKRMNNYIRSEFKWKE